MALTILSSWLSKKIRYSVMATIVFRFMISSNVGQLKFDIQVSTLVFGSTLPFYSTELVEKNGTTFTWIQKPIFTCVKPNAYITNALIDYFYPTGVCRFLPMASLPTHTACFDLLDQNGWKSGEICVPLASRSRNVHIHLQLFYTSGVIYDFYPPWLHLRGKQPLHFHN